MELQTRKAPTSHTGIVMHDEIDELLADWYDWQQSYRPKLGYGRADVACRGYQAGWRESDDLADIAEANARKRVCEAVEACVSRLDLRARVAIQTEMRSRYSSPVWSSIRLPGELADEYDRAKRMLEPLLLAADLIDRACKLD